uniref:Uncharacterized protein n=1 Tax=Anguilla anguilla TaxID=7936 RepID=A0A0E9QXM7_ANGAN
MYLHQFNRRQTLRQKKERDDICLALITVESHREHISLQE